MRNRIGNRLAVVALLFVAAPAAADKPSEEFAAEYREVLGELSTGDMDRALADLRGLEARTVGDLQTQQAIERLWKFKLRVIRDLIAAESLDVVVPIIVFHHEAAALYREERQPILALHSRTMVDELTDYYADRAEEEERADDFAAWVFTSLAGYAQEMRSFSSSRTFFERVLERDPENEFALLSLGVTYEMHAKYPEALEIYDRLLQLRPDHAEARLRKALCHLRGTENETFDYQPLNEIEQVALDPEALEWVRSIAFEELAGLLMRAERRIEAESWLWRGLQELPGDHHQRIQLAALLERRGERSQAWEVLAAIEAKPESSDSPRRRYDRLPQEGLPAARSQMREVMSYRLPLLASSLGVTPVAGAGQQERIGR